MSAVARVWWTFFTAIPLQRWLAGSGVVLAGLLGIAGFVWQESPFWAFGFIAFVILIVFPAFFASAAVFRALSAARANQLRPRFRARMLGAILALQAAGVLLVALLLLALAITFGRTLPLEPLVYVFAIGTATFMSMFLVFGDWRWIWAWIGTTVAFTAFGVSAGPALAAIPAAAWLAVSLGAWVAFGGWYLRAWRIGPLALVPQPPTRRWSRFEQGGELSREQALRALISAQPPGSQQLRPGSLLRLFAGVAVIIVITVVSRPDGRLFPFTSFVWPLAAMVLLWGKATAVVHRSRLLWLRIPGARDAVRREVESALLRNVAGAGLLLLGMAALYSSPLLAAPPREVLAGLALSICAALFSSYAALAAIPGNLPQLAAFAVLMVAQIGLLARSSPALTDVIIVTAIELVGAITFRAFAIARWRHVDWLRLRPLPLTNMFRDA